MKRYQFHAVLLAMVAIGALATLPGKIVGQVSDVSPLSVTRVNNLEITGTTLATGLVTATAGLTTPANLTTSGAGDLSVADDGTITGDFSAGADGFEVSATGQSYMGDTVRTAIGNNLNTLTLGQTGTGQTASTIGVVLTNTGTYDTTAALLAPRGLDISVTSTKSAGANSLVNIAADFNASGGTSNFAVRTVSGDNAFNLTSGTSTFYGTTTTIAGNLIAGTLTTNSHTVRGNLNLFETVGTTFGGMAAGNTNLSFIDDTAYAAGVGGGFVFQAKFSSAATYVVSGGVKSMKANATDGNDEFDLVLGAKANGATTAEGCRLLGATKSLSCVGGITASSGLTSGDANTDFMTVYGHDVSLGTAPAANAACDGATAATVTGTDRDFYSTTGTGAVACTWTFSRTYTVKPTCTGFAEGGVGAPTCTISATAITCTVVTVGTYHWHCATSAGGS